MNRKNLTAAVLAGLAGVAGLAGTAQAVNLNPDGLGQVLIYPYYTANDGNATILSVVNTTNSAKAVKVRFLEGFNSREVLDFNLYLSHHDVWVANIVPAVGDAPAKNNEWETDTALLIPDDSCTVPYLYEDTQIELADGTKAGFQRFLNYAYVGNANDGGPTTDSRAAEGHFEMIEMGTITADSDTEDAITHMLHKGKDAEGEAITWWAPGDCDELVENWTDYVGSGDDGIWFEEAKENNEEEDCFDGDGLENSDFAGCNQAYTDTERNSGGLFGGAAVINPGNGAMFSYDAKALQGFDKTETGIHYVPGTIHPSLADGNQRVAYVFFGVPQNEVRPLPYVHSIGAISAVFMHEFVMNEYTTADIPAEAATEWVVTFPTKNFYADPLRIGLGTDSEWIPTTDSEGEGIASCNDWEEGFTYPTTKSLNSDIPIDGPGPWPGNPGWENCYYEEDEFYVSADLAVAPFTELYGAEDCELVSLVTWDRDERTFLEEREGVRPPVVSPAPPIVCNPSIEFCLDVIFELCNEVNVLRFGERSIFGTLADVDGDSLLLTVNDEFTDGWGHINFGFDKDHQDSLGLVGLPVTGFAAYQFENGFVEGDDGTVKAFYGGLYDHKANVRQKEVDRDNL
jgi:hypothetical protein